MFFNHFDDGAARPGLEAVLQPGAEALQPVLDPQDRTDDSADQQGAEHDQQRRAVADRGRPRRVGDAGGGECRDQQGDQAEAVGHHVAGTVGEAVPEQYADGRADEHGDDVDERAQPWEHGAPLPNRDV